MGIRIEIKNLPKELKKRELEEKLAEICKLEKQISEILSKEVLDKN